MIDRIKSQRKAKDFLLRMAVTCGSGLVILSFVGIIGVILSETVGLFWGTRYALDWSVKPLESKQNGGQVALDDYQYITSGNSLLLLNKKGVSFKSEHLLSVREGNIEGADNNLSKYLKDTNSTITAFAKAGQGSYAIASSAGEIIPFSVSVSDDHSLVQPTFIKAELPLKIPNVDESVVKLAINGDGADRSYAVLTSTGKLYLLKTTQKKSILGKQKSASSVSEGELNVQGAPTQMVLDKSGNSFFIGTSLGEIAWFKKQSGGTLVQKQVLRLSGQNQTEITSLALLYGGQTLVVGASDDTLSSWSIVNDSSVGEETLYLLRRFDYPGGRIISIAGSPRNRSFLVSNVLGQVFLYFSTSGDQRKSWDLGASGGIRHCDFLEKGQSAIILTDKLVETYLKIIDPYPEATFKTLFSPINYEGYPNPRYIWQSSGGSDGFEPKLSLIPLIFGTLKGTFYSLLFAIPIAILAALYTSQFAPPRLKQIAKPVVEMLASLPSVVLGLVAILWLAPLLANALPGLFIAFFFVPVSVYFLARVYPLCPWGARATTAGQTREFLIITACIIASLFLSMKLGSYCSEVFMNSSPGTWLYQKLGLTYDQRNTIIVALVLSIAVIPLIFTIAEDCFSSVPESVKAGAYALGASRWHTAITVVFPSALPGVISAIMIGVGRAVGETMIVLMASGNTPLLDLSPFLGLRSLSANLAIELPEAAYGETLYRVLFLSALILLVFTFCLNLAGEVVRARMRRRFG